MVQIMRKLLILTCIVALSACATSFDPADAYKNMSAKEIFDAGEKSLTTGYYTDAKQYFDTYDARYPFGDDIEQVQLDTIYANYKMQDNASTLAAADRFIHLHPSSQHVDYAYYMRGLANFMSNIGAIDKYLPIDLATRDLTDAKRSFLAFTDLVHRFPNSQYTPDARQHLVFLRNILAKHEYNIALYYYKHEAYVASSGRANEVVKHYQGAPIVPKAMVLMIKSYEKLGLVELASDAQKILALNVSPIPQIDDIN